MKLVGLLLLCLSLPLNAAEVFRFGVANQRPVMLTAQLWNPILSYVSRKSGVPLTLAMGKTATETTEMAVSGQLDFLYSNTLFTPERDKLGFHAIARLNGRPVRGQIVVLQDSPIHTLRDLDGRKMASPTTDSFISYALQIRALNSAGVSVQTVVTGSQEGGILQLANGEVAAAAVHSQIMRAFAEREHLSYRIIYSSEPYLDLPIMASARVPASTVEKVRIALLGMNSDDEGRRILKQANEILKFAQPLAFVAVKDRDYDNYRSFYRHIVARRSP